MEMEKLEKIAGELKNVADFKDPNDPKGRTYREVNNARTHRFEVGDLVEMDTGARVFVAWRYRDCDGTPLYALTPEKDDYEIYDKRFFNKNWINGIMEDGLELVGLGAREICDFWKVPASLFAATMANRNYFSVDLLSDTLEMIGDNLACPMCEHFEVCRLRLNKHVIRPNHYASSLNRNLLWAVDQAFAANCNHFKFDTPTPSGRNDDE